MKIANLKSGVIFTLILLNSFLSYSQTPTVPAAPAGKWEGKLQFPGSALRIYLEITEPAPGKFAARMISPDQDGSKIKAHTVSWVGDSLFLDVKVIKGTYAAKLSADKTTLTGIWTQGPGSLPLILKNNPALQFESNRPQEPKRPYPYKEENVKYQNTKAGISIGGTLTLPHGAGPFPAVLLITGSGAQDRNEALMGHKPFLIISDYLTRRGIAVLRVDDRGVDSTGGDALTATTADNASDAFAGVKYLQSRADIQKNKIGLIGHSEGGVIAPMVASQTNDVAFIVLLAGVGVLPQHLLLRQREDMMRQAKSKEEDIQKALALLTKVYDLLSAENYSPAVEEKLSKLFQENAPVKGADVSPMVKYFTLPWMRYFIKLNPQLYLQKVTCPVLALNGTNDIQVAAKENLAAIETAINGGGNSNVTVQELPGLNHLFQTAKTGAVADYALIEETFSPVALKVIGDWIEGVVK